MPALPEPAFFRAPEFLRWRHIFETRELKDWYIYSNATFRFFSQASHRIAARALKREGSRAPLLEIGAGAGALLDLYPAQGGYVGVDIAMDGLAELKRRHPDALAVCASSTALPFGDAAFSRIASLHTLEHLYHLAESIEEICRIMSVEGTLHYGLPTEGGWGFWLGRQLLSGRNARRKYDIDPDYVMDREHINDAPRVLKFLRMYFETVEKRYWPLPFAPLLSPNALVHGTARHPNIPPEA